jgi:heat shock protein HslJ
VSRRPIGVKTILLATAALLAAATLSSCGDEQPGAAAPDTPAALSLDDLDGRLFASVRVDGHTLVPDSHVRLGFTGSDLSAEAGCNHLFGKVTIEDDTLVVSNMGGTEMGCPEERMAQDAWLIEFLTAGPAVTLADETLTLSGGDVVIELAEEDPPAAPTGDPEDGVVTSNEGDGGVSSP